jgi:hypothetical protein
MWEFFHNVQRNTCRCYWNHVIRFGSKKRSGKIKTLQFFQKKVFRDVRVFRLVNTSQPFRLEICYLLQGLLITKKIQIFYSHWRLRENFFLNVVLYQTYTASCHRKFERSLTPLWEPQILYIKFLFTGRHM